ncbi:MAG: hypothetical protein ACK5NG_05875 [Chthoniobacterales bacterium]
MSEVDCSQFGGRFAMSESADETKPALHRISQRSQNSGESDINKRNVTHHNFALPIVGNEEDVAREKGFCSACREHKFRAGNVETGHFGLAIFRVVLRVIL